MKRNAFLAHRLQEVLLDGTWIANTNYNTQIESITWQQAILKVGQLNTIAALTFHINYYLDGLLAVFEGGALEIRDQFSFDLPPITSESQWNELKQTFLSNAEKFVAVVANMDDALFDDVFVDEKYGSYWRNIEGVIEHSYYHLGQIALIKKMMVKI